VASLSGSGPTRSPLRQRLSTIARPAASPGLIVSQVEYRLTLSRGTLRAGRVALEAVDRGRDPHDLRVRPLSGGRETAAPQLKPGQRWQTTVLLRPGIYELWCSLPEHARLGMRMRLTVVR
jgi:hypothetical protein